MTTKIRTIDDLAKIIGGISKLDELGVPEIIPTNLEALDEDVFGVGGLARGRFTEVFAKEGVGKTSFALAISGLLTQQGLQVGWVEAEGTLTADYAISCGVIEENFHVIRDFTTGEDALQKIKRMIASDFFDLIVLDSIPKLVPEAVSEAVSEKASMYDKQQMAAMYGHWFDTLNGFKVKGADGKFMLNKKKYERGGKKVNDWHKFCDSKTHIIFINHAMDAIGSNIKGAVNTPGGRKAKFEATNRLWLKNKGVDKNDDGSLKMRNIGVFCVKNKLAPPFGYALVQLDAKGNLTATRDETILIDIAVAKGLIHQAGPMYYIKETGTENIKKLPETHRLKGKERVIEFINAEENVEFRKRILTHE